MATDKYKYDLFVSYAHANNRRDPWVDELTAAVADEYRQQTDKQLSVFKDTVLLPRERWKDKILTAVKASRCLLATFGRRPVLINSVSKRVNAPLCLRGVLPTVCNKASTA